MSASYQQAYEPNAVLKPEAPTSMGGESAKYHSTGGQGFGFEGKEIRAGVMEFSSYKSGGSRKRRRQQKKRRSEKKRRSGKRRR
jgi:hypothetical protein